jgi:hypothetical protein
MSVIIGIDPGVHTGLATWCCHSHRLTAVLCTDILSSMDLMLERHQAGLLDHVVWEDARLRTWFGSKGREALQGAGSIKRDCQIWEAFLVRHGITFRALAPAKCATKWDADKFGRLTGWVGRTNEHARDAALLVYQAKPLKKEATCP